MGVGTLSWWAGLSNKHSPNGAIRTCLFLTLWISSVVAGNVTVEAALIGGKAVASPNIVAIKECD